MDSPTAFASCAVPNADESNHSATGTLHLHNSAAFFLYVTLCHPILPRNCPPLLQVDLGLHRTHFTGPTEPTIPSGNSIESAVLIKYTVVTNGDRQRDRRQNDHGNRPLSTGPICYSTEMRLINNECHWQFRTLSIHKRAPWWSTADKLKFFIDISVSVATTGHVTVYVVSCGCI